MNKIVKFEYIHKICYNYKDVVGKTNSQNFSGGERMEEKYKVSYNGVEIGVLFIKTNEKEVKHRYIPALKGLKEVGKDLILFPELFENSGCWVNPLPVFENRIKDAKRFGNDSVIANQTDGFVLEKIED